MNRLIAKFIKEENLELYGTIYKTKDRYGSLCKFLILYNRRKYPSIYGKLIDNEQFSDIAVTEGEVSIWPDDLIDQSGDAHEFLTQIEVGSALHASLEDLHKFLGGLEYDVVEKEQQELKEMETGRAKSHTKEIYL